MRNDKECKGCMSLLNDNKINDDNYRKWLAYNHPDKRGDPEIFKIFSNCIDKIIKTDDCLTHSGKIKRTERKREQDKRKQEEEEYERKREESYKRRKKEESERRKRDEEINKKRESEKKRSIAKQKSDIRKRRTVKRQKKEQEEREKKEKEEQLFLRNKLFASKIGSVIFKKKLQNTLRKLKKDKELSDAVSKIQKAYKRSLLKKELKSRINKKSPKTKKRIKDESQKRIDFYRKRDEIIREAVSKGKQYSINFKKNMDKNEQNRIEFDRKRLSIIKEAVSKSKRRNQINDVTSLFDQLNITSPKKAIKRLRSDDFEMMDIDSPSPVKKPPRKKSRRT